jgi:hypothetical protein
MIFAACMQQQVGDGQQWLEIDGHGHTVYSHLALTSPIKFNTLSLYHANKSIGLIWSLNHLYVPYTPFSV